MPYTKNFFSSKIEIFHQKIFDIFLIFAQNIDCGYTLEPPRRGGSNEYPQSMFWSKIRKIGIPCIPQFYYIKVGFEGVYFARTCFADAVFVLISAHAPISAHPNHFRKSCA